MSVSPDVVSNCKQTTVCPTSETPAQVSAEFNSFPAPTWRLFHRSARRASHRNSPSIIRPSLLDRLSKCISPVDYSIHLRRDAEYWDDSLRDAHRSALRAEFEKVTYWYMDKSIDCSRANWLLWYFRDLKQELEDFKFLEFHRIYDFGLLSLDLRWNPLEYWPIDFVVTQKTKELIAFVEECEWKLRTHQPVPRYYEWLDDIDSRLNMTRYRVNPPGKRRNFGPPFVFPLCRCMVPLYEIPTAEAPATKIPATKTPVTVTPVTLIPTTLIPTTETPATKVLAPDVPDTSIPDAEILVAEVPDAEANLPNAKADIADAEAESKHIGKRFAVGIKRLIRKTLSDHCDHAAQIPDIDIPDVEADVPDSDNHDSETLAAEVPDSEFLIPDAAADIPDAESNIPVADSDITVVDIPFPDVDIPDDGADVADVEVESKHIGKRFAARIKKLIRKKPSDDCDHAAEVPDPEIPIPDPDSGLTDVDIPDADVDIPDAEANIPFPDVDSPVPFTPPPPRTPLLYTAEFSPASVIPIEEKKADDPLNPAILGSESVVEPEPVGELTTELDAEPEVHPESKPKSKFKFFHSRRHRKHSKPSSESTVHDKSKSNHKGKRFAVKIKKVFRKTSADDSDHAAEIPDIDLADAEDAEVPDTEVPDADADVPDADADVPDADADLADAEDAEVPDTEVPDADADVPDADADVPDADADIADAEDAEVPDTEVRDADVSEAVTLVAETLADDVCDTENPPAEAPTTEVPQKERHSHKHRHHRHRVVSSDDSPTLPLFYGREPPPSFVKEPVSTPTPPPCDLMRHCMKLVDDELQRVQAEAELPSDVCAVENPPAEAPTTEVPQKERHSHKHRHHRHRVVSSDDSPTLPLFYGREPPPSFVKEPVSTPTAEAPTTEVSQKKRHSHKHRHHRHRVVSSDDSPTLPLFYGREPPPSFVKERVSTPTPPQKVAPSDTQGTSVADGKPPPCDFMRRYMKVIDDELRKAQAEAERQLARENTTSSGNSPSLSL